MRLVRLEADLEALAAFRDSAAPGWTRPVFSGPYLASRDWVAGRMADAGLAVFRDAAGNLVGTLPGADGPALVTGSHTDSVNGGGRFDGPLGVLGAIEAARCIAKSGTQLQHHLRVVDFLGEEPNDFGLSCIGSRAVAGNLTEQQLSLKDRGGRTLGDALRSAGGSPEAVANAAWQPGEVAAFVELHIEQGPILEREGVPLGIVSGIAGIARAKLTFSGQADHAGTTPMDSRHDALCAAAEAILAVERLASDGTGVGTCGRLEVQPGALNVVPGRADLWCEFRSTDPAWLDSRLDLLEAEAAGAGRRRGVATAFERLSRTEPVATSPEVRAAMERGIAGLSLDWRTLASGAGHDAVQMARLGPVGMIFVPSRGGRSHCPEEWTEPAHLEAGVAALLATLLELDRA
ncbi:MAG: M20 family metallo-hydrolase [Candidatus Dormibacteraeota bacterium]|nr:M20 family metallo-hydrolase [Candidatus Dormibacteraeota bacterium]